MLNLSFLRTVNPDPRLLTVVVLSALIIAALTAALCIALRSARRATTELRESEAKFRMVIETMHEGVVIRDGDGEIVVANAQGLEILGMTLDQLQGRSSPELTLQTIYEDGRPWPHEDWPSQVALRERKPQRDRVMGLRLTWGETLWLSLSAVPLFREGEEKPYLVVTPFSDVTVRKRREDRTRRQIERVHDVNAELAEANARLADMALTDGLTGLRNHRAFRERLAEEVEQSHRNGRPLSLILLDVDEFKTYNDRFGHLEGDEALKQVAYVLTTVARATDFVARYGGEEFAVLLPEADELTALAIAERLRAAVQAAHWPKRAITASFGVSTLQEDGESEGLIGEADAALYRAKRAGRNRVGKAQEGGESFLHVA